MSAFERMRPEARRRSYVGVAVQHEVPQADEWRVAGTEPCPVASVARLLCEAPADDHEVSAMAARVGARLFGRRAP